MKLRCLFALLGALACSSDAVPAPIGDELATPSHDAGAAAAERCATPSRGCPCADAGAQIDCGLVYRYSGTHVDCSHGTMTCGDDGGWGACVGPTVYQGN